jgi:hypothetical protein
LIARRCLMRCTNHEVVHYAVSSRAPLVPVSQSKISPLLSNSVTSSPYALPLIWETNIIIIIIIIIYM